MNFRYLFLSVGFFNISLLGMNNNNFLVADADTRNYCLNELAINSEFNTDYSNNPVVRSQEVQPVFRSLNDLPKRCDTFNCFIL